MGIDFFVMEWDHYFVDHLVMVISNDFCICEMRTTSTIVRQFKKRKKIHVSAFSSMSILNLIPKGL